MNFEIIYYSLKTQTQSKHNQKHNNFMKRRKFISNFFMYSNFYIDACLVKNADFRSLTLNINFIQRKFSNRNIMIAVSILISHLTVAHCAVCVNVHCLKHTNANQATP